MLLKPISIRCLAIVFPRSHRPTSSLFELLCFLSLESLVLLPAVELLIELLSPQLNLLKGRALVLFSLARGKLQARYN